MSTFVLMAGGTGGHLFPAMSLAQELRRRGHVIHLMTDHRVSSYGGDFPAREVHIVPAATPSLGNPVKFVRAGFTILGGIGTAMRQLRKIRPDAIVGFGGYPVFPPFIAASLLGIPGLLHEQNTVMGRANRALARFADLLALSFDETRFADRFRVEKQVTGNPVRDTVRALAGTPYPPINDNEAIRLLDFGGSQGARIFADLVPPAIATLPAEERADYLEAVGLKETGLDRLIRAGYALLHLVTYFTVGPKETRAWTIMAGTKAPQAAGVIHTDFEKGFIRAETISYDDYIATGGEAGARDAGKMRLEGKDYVVKDGDIMHYRFAT